MRTHGHWTPTVLSAYMHALRQFHDAATRLAKPSHLKTARVAVTQADTMSAAQLNAVMERWRTLHGARMAQAVMGSRS